MTHPDLLFWRLSTLLSGLGFVALAVFVAVPDLDLWSAALFFDGAGFPLRSDPRLTALRLLYRLAFVAACLVVALTLLLRLVFPSDWQTPLRLWLFFCALLATGPGLVANALFKEHWGRARPDALEVFGGDRPFTLPFALGDACATNCSFVSGEGAAAAALAFGLLSAFWPALCTPRARWLALAATGLWLAGAVWIRMGAGKHFLSDSVFAFVLMGIVTALLYRALALGRVRVGLTPAMVLDDLARSVALLVAAAASLGRSRVVRPEPCIAHGDELTGAARE